MSKRVVQGFVWGSRKELTLWDIEKFLGGPGAVSGDTLKGKQGPLASKNHEV